MHAFNVDGLWILHMGDVGYELIAEELVLFADHCDMILVLTGKTLTMSFQSLDRMIANLPLFGSCRCVTGFHLRSFQNNKNSTAPGGYH